MGRKSRRNTATEGIIEKDIEPEVYPTAIYVRLSVENLGKDDRGAAIENQKDVCREYVSQCPDLDLVRIYEDNGWTGTVMQRPAFEEMMEDVQKGLIKAVVVRDLSRFARNYIEAGTYLERIFPGLGVRFISLKERLDTLKVKDASESLIVPLQNLINDLYSKDISRKVETALQNQMSEGTFSWRTVPYGYKKNEDHTNIVPDEEGADIVRQIFQWKSEGVFLNEIVRRLNDSNAIKSTGTCNQGKHWGDNRSITGILRNPAYIGIRVLGKEHSAIYKGIKREKTTPDRWYIFPDAHEPIVSRELFDKVQEMMDEASRKRRTSMAQSAKSLAKLIDLFEQKIFCADCGGRMYFSRHQFPEKERGWFGRYLCSSYQVRYAEHRCTSHYINQKNLEAKVWGAVRAHIRLALEYEKLVAKFENSEKDKRIRRQLDTSIRSASQKLNAIHRKRTRLYEDYVEGILNAEEYSFAKQAYEAENEECNTRLEELIAKRRVYQETISPRNQWIQTMRTMTKRKKLSQKLVDETIERIDVYEGGNINIVMKYQDIFELTKNYLESGESNA